MLLMIDNYDSFTYNLVQYFGELGREVKVFRNDRISLEEIKALSPREIVISPGPGRPSNAGISRDLIQCFKGVYPILGVCLGHQCIGEVFGAKIKRAPRIMHGKTSRVFHNRRKLFMKIENPFEATRYHSLIIEGKSMPASLNITSWTEENEIMGIQHNRYFIQGIQFHPESILTGCGKKILQNFLHMSEKFWATDR